MSFHQSTPSQASGEIRLLMKPVIMNRDNGKEGEHNKEVYDIEKKGTIN